MKKITGIVLIIVILLCIANQYFAQAYFPIPQNNISCDTNSLNLIYDQANELRNSNLDSSIKLSLQNLQCAEFLLNDTNIKIKLFSNKIINDIYLQLGESYGLKKDTVNAFNCLDKSLKGHINESDKWGQAFTYAVIGLIYLRENKYDLSLDNYFKALKIREELNDKTEIAWNYDRIAEVYDYMEDFKNSLDYNFKSLKISEELNDKLNIAIKYNTIGNVYDLLKDYYNSLEYYLKAQKIYEEENDSINIAWIIGNIGMNNSKRGEYLKALTFYISAIQLHDKHENDNGINWCLDRLNIDFDYHKNINKSLIYLNNVIKQSEKCLIVKSWAFQLFGNEYNVLKDYDKSLEYYSKAKQIHEKDKDSSNYAWDIGNIGMIYSKKGEYIKAIQFYISAIQMHDKLKNEDGVKWNINRLYCDYDSLFNNNLDIKKGFLSNYLNELAYQSLEKECLITEAIANSNQGLLAFYLRENEKAYDYFDYARHLYIKLKDTLGYASCISNIGIYYSKKGDHKKAIEFKTISLKAYEKYEDTLKILFCLSHIAYDYMDIGNFDTSFTLLKKAFTISEKVNNKYWIAKSYSALGYYYTNIGDSIIAFKNYDDAIDIFKEIKNSNSVAYCYQHIAYTNELFNNLNGSIENNYKAIKIFENLNDSINLFYIYLKLNYLYTKISETEITNYKLKHESYLKAEECYNKTLVYSENLEIDEKSFIDFTKNYYERIGRSDALIKMFLNKKAKTEYLLKVSNNKVSDLEKENQIKRLEIWKNKLEIENKAKDLLLAKNLFKKEKTDKELYKSRDSATQQAIIIKDQAIQFEKLKQQQQDSSNKFNQEILAQKIEYQEFINFLLIVIGLPGLIIIIFISRLIYLYSKRKREKEKVELNLQMNEIEMKSLRSQLNPHFIFNCVNTIKDLVKNQDAKYTEDYLNKFGKLTRRVLDNSEYKEISLKEEIETLQIYIDIENVRFKENPFISEIIIDSVIDKEKTLIPPFILQPFIENSIHHGFCNKTQTWHLKIMIKIENGILLCIIEDNGIGISVSQKIRSASIYKKESKGLKIINDRLNLITKTKNIKSYFLSDDLLNEITHSTGTRIKLFLPYELSL